MFTGCQVFHAKLPLPPEDSLLGALLFVAMFGHDYLKRIWTIQEVALSDFMRCSLWQSQNTVGTVYECCNEVHKF
jgi:hypothetical protein